MPHRPTAFDWMLVASLVVAWGSSFVLSKLALVEVEPYWIAAARLIVGAVVVCAFAAVKRQLPGLKVRSSLYFVWLGFIGNAAPFVLITWGMLHVPSGVAGLLMGAIPLFTIVFSHFTLPDETLTPQKTAGFLLGFIGIIVLIGSEALSNVLFTGNALLGQLAVILGCVCYAINSVTAKRFGSGGIYEQSAGVLVMGAVLATMFACFAAPFTLHNASMPAVLAVLGLGLLPTGFATIVWFKVLERNGPSFTSITNYLVPVYAVIFGALLLGEPVGWNALAALALILLGVFVARFKPQPLR